MFNNINELLAHPSSIFALVGTGILIMAFFYIKNVKMTTKMIVHVGLMIALAILLHQIRIYHMPQGGSITLGSMIPLLLISFCYGPAVGYLAGFIYGIMNLILSPYIFHPVQVLFDYPLPYMALGIAGYFKNKLFLGTSLAVSVRFICHFISGAVFFGSYAPAGTSPYTYSFMFNIAYIVPELIITLLLLKLLPLKTLLTQMKP